MDVALSLLGHEFRIRCECERALALVKRNFSAALSSPSDQAAACYQINAHAEGWALVLGTQRVIAADAADLLYLIERQLVLDLQAARADLLFVHAAVLGDENGAILLVAPSGTGKSTTALALAERGLRYLSDELAPVDVERGVVHPYPHALCLKTALPARYRGKGFATGPTAHIGAEYLNLANLPLPLHTLFFLMRGDEPGPWLHAISQAQAAAHLFPEVLNGLAHPAYGLDAALRMSAQPAAWLLHLGDVDASADAIMAALTRQSSGVPA